MAIYYTKHATERMRRRNVTKRQVEEALYNPDWTEKTRDEREISIKRYGKREIEVIYKKIRNNYIIITVRVWIK